MTVLASYFNSDKYLLTPDHSLAALSLNLGYTANLESAADRIVRYRHPAIVMAMFNSPLTAEVIRLLAEWHGETMSSHSYSALITPNTHSWLGTSDVNSRFIRSGEGSWLSSL